MNDPNLLSLDSQHMQKHYRFVRHHVQKKVKAKVSEVWHRLFTGSKNLGEDFSQSQFNIWNGLFFKLVSTRNKQQRLVKKFQISVNGVGKKRTVVSGCQTGLHLKLLVKRVSLYCAVAVNALAKETINTIELVFAAQRCVNLKADVSTMAILQQSQ